MKRKNIFPKIVTELSEAEIRFHKHKAQWGIVLEGEIIKVVQENPSYFVDILKVGKL